MSKVKFNENGTILVSEVILSYPHLYEPYGRETDKKKKYSAKFLLPKATHKEAIKAILAHIDKLCIEKWKQKQPPTNVFLKNGELVRKDEGDENYFFLSASETIKPRVVDRDGRTPIPEEDADGKMYPGAVVDVLINPWSQDNEWGKKLNANLLAVRFRAKGERRAGSRADVKPEDYFEDISGAFGDDDDGFGGDFGDDGFGD